MLNESGLNQRYEIKERIGQGGMGEVYRAWDKVTARDVTIKTLRDHQNDAALEQFRNECRVLASLNHANIVDIYDLGDIQGRPYFVMPLLPGDTLAAIEEQARLPVERVVDITAQACRGLQAAHERGLLHRDLKPSNIFVLPGDSVKIIDFGIASVAHKRSTMHMRGTLLYMSPEQTELKTLSPRSDLFSLAVVCYEALTGRRPFSGTSGEETVHAIRHEAATPASDLNPAVNQKISQVLHKAMAKQPSLRFRSIQEFGVCLQKALREEPIEYFDEARLGVRLDRVRQAIEDGETDLASEVLGAVEAETYHPDVVALRRSIDKSVKETEIRRQLDGARQRLDLGEHQLALQRVQNALDIDPSHPEALGLQAEIENRSRAEQFELWLGLARKHLDNHSFQHAREALDKVLAGDPTNSQGVDLLAELERREQQYNRLQNEKTELYRQALEDVEQGELTGGLSKLERVIKLDEQAPDTMGPERQKIFERVRSQHRELNDSYERAVQLRSEKKTAEALELCEQVLAKHSGHALFSALKLDLESDQSQQLSAYIAEVDAILNAEPDLGRRLKIITEAVEKYPAESRFQQRLHSVGAKAELVQSIVLRARGYEKDGKFVEALAQWETLRTVYPQYPGLELETDRVAKRREIQTRSETKQRWVEQVEEARKSGEWRLAETHLEEALAQLSGDAELEELREMTREGKHRADQAKQLLEEAKLKLAEPEGGAEAVELLRQAYQRDSRNLLVRNTLLDALLKRAQSLLDKDWHDAEPYAREAAALNLENNAASGLLSLIDDRKQEEAVDRWVSETRRLERAGDLDGALGSARHALTEYPTETRLHKLVRSLSEEVAHQAKTTSNGDPAPEPALSTPADMARTEAPTIASGETVPAQQPIAPTTEPPAKNVPASGERSRLPLWGAAAAAVAALALIAGWLWSGVESPSLPQDIAYAIESDPVGARVLIDGDEAGTTPLSVSLAAGTHRIELIQSGYFRLGESLDVAASTDEAASGALDLAFVLNPIPAALHLSADIEQAEATLDGETKVALEDGLVELVDLSAGRHRLEFNARGGLQAAFDFISEPGQAPELIGAPRISNLQATLVAGLGDRLRLWAGDLPAQVSVDGEPHGELGVDGLLVENLEPGVHEVTIETGRGTRTLLARLGATPTLSVFLATDRDVGDLYITSNETEDVTVLVDGRSRRYRARGGRIRVYGLPAGVRRVSVRKEGFREPATQSASITKGEVASLSFRLERLPSIGTLTLSDAPPGIEVLIDGEAVGVADENGSLSKSGLTSGEHVIELRGKGYRAKSLRKNFGAEAQTKIEGEEASLTMARGTLLFKLDPPAMTLDLDPAVMDAGRFEGRTRYPEAPLRMELQTGIYNLTFSAPGRGSHTINLQLAEGETKTIPVSLSLDEERKLTSGDPMDGWDQPEAWADNDGWFLRKGAGYALYAPEVSRGVFRFTTQLPSPVIGSGKPTAWVVGYKSRGDLLLFAVNKRDFSRSRLVNGKAQGELSVQHGLDAKQEQSFEVEIRDNRVRCSVLVDGRSKVLDSWDIEVGDGRFGFWIPTGKELAIRGFSVRGR